MVLLMSLLFPVFPLFWHPCCCWLFCCCWRHCCGWCHPCYFCVVMMYCPADVALMLLPLFLCCCRPEFSCKNIKTNLLSHVYSTLQIPEFTKYLHIIEHRAVSGVLQTTDPPPPLHPATVSKRRGVHTCRAVRGEGGGSIFWKTPAIGLASYSIIPLRLN